MISQAKFASNHYLIQRLYAQCLTNVISTEKCRKVAYIYQYKMQ